MRTCKPTYKQSSRKIAHNRAENQENNLLWRKVRGCALLAVLVALIVVNKAADSGEAAAWSYQAWTSTSTPHAQANPSMHRADWIGDIIDLIDDIIDIIEGESEGEGEGEGESNGDGDGDGGDAGDGGDERDGGDALEPDAP